nr:MAG TPA: YopX protein [Caudoviricetes sp.]
MLRAKVFIKTKRKVSDVEQVDFSKKVVEIYDEYYRGFEDPSIGFENYTFDEVEFMDNTGFKDKNGANIYTGNIVEYVRRHPDVGTLRGVICKNEYGAYVIELYVMKNRMDEVCEKIDQMLGSKVEYEKPNLSFLLDGTTHDGCVVLGNIYENKELLEC